MGIQSWKRGVHTGNTIRVGGSSAQIRCLGNQSGLVKRQVYPPSEVTAPFLEPEEERKRIRRRGGRAKKVTQETKRYIEVEELEELEENVFYSLNKKGWWNLPEMIRTEIRDSKCMPKENSRNSWPIHKDTKRPSRRNLSSEEICDIMKIDEYGDRKYCCNDAGDWVADDCRGDECRIELTRHQPHRKDRKGDVQRAKPVAVPEEDSYVWFLEEFVQMPSSAFQDDTAKEEEGQQEIKEQQNENLDNENVLNRVANDSSLEIPGVSEESQDWELLEYEVPSEVEEFHEGELGNGILAMLIEDALVRKTTRLQITQEDSRINRRKDKKRK